MNALNSLKKIGGKASGSQPLLTDPSAVIAASEWLSAKAELAKAEARLEVAEVSLRPLVTRGWFEINHGRPKAETSLKVPTDRGSVLVSFASVWRGGEGILSEDLLREKWQVKIDGDLIPSEKGQAFTDELVELADKHGVRDSLSAKSTKYPVEGFNDKRHTAMSVDENLAAEANGLGTRLTLKVAA